MSSPLGTVYLIHFEKPIGDLSNPKGQASHYLGWSSSLDERLEEHRCGNGSKIMAAVSQYGISWELVRTWGSVPRAFERKIKNQHHHWRHCPVCRAERIGKQ